MKPANDMFGNSKVDGQAPGAKLVSSRACSWGGGCTAAALTTGMDRETNVENIQNRLAWFESFGREGDDSVEGRTDAALTTIANGVT